MVKGEFVVEHEAIDFPKRRNEYLTRGPIIDDVLMIRHCFFMMETPGWGFISLFGESLRRRRRVTLIHVLRCKGYDNTGIEVDLFS